MLYIEAMCISNNLDGNVVFPIKMHFEKWFLNALPEFSLDIRRYARMQMIYKSSVHHRFSPAHSCLMLDTRVVWPGERRGQLSSLKPVSWSLQSLRSLVMSHKQCDSAPSLCQPSCGDQKDRCSSVLSDALQVALPPHWKSSVCTCSKALNCCSP